METIVASFLLGLSCTLMMSFLVYSLRQTQRNQVRQELILGGERVVDQVLSSYAASRDTYLLTNSSINGVLIAQASAVYSNRTLFDSNGALLWSSWKAFGYDASKRQVWRAWQSFATPTSGGGELSTGPTAIPPSNWSRRVLAQNVTLFSVTGPTNGLIRVRVVLTDSQGYQVEVASSGENLN